MSDDEFCAAGKSQSMAMPAGRPARAPTHTTKRRTTVIHARGLVQTFETRQGAEKTEVGAVDGVDLDVAEGEVVGFLGPNGAGKTTTLRMLTTLLRPTAGTATVAGYDVVTQAEEVRRSIGYVSQSGSTGSIARAGEEVVDHGMLYGMTSADARRRGPAAVRAARPRGAVGPPAEGDVRGPAPPARHRHGPDPRADPGLPRRADHRARPAGPRQPVDSTSPTCASGAGPPSSSRRTTSTRPTR